MILPEMARTTKNLENLGKDFIDYSIMGNLLNLCSFFYTFHNKDNVVIKKKKAAFKKMVQLEL